MISNEDFFDDVEWDLKAFLKNELDDPKDSRNADDEFIWIGETQSEAGSEEHKPPFVILAVEDGDDEPMGPLKMGRSDDYSVTIQFRVITGGIKNRNLASRIASKIKDALDDQNSNVSPTGTGPNGRDYDISILEYDNFTQPNDRSQYRDDNYRERAIQGTFQAWFVNGQA